MRTYFGSRTSGRRLRREIISLIYWLKALSVHPLSTRRWTSGDSCLGSWTGFPNSPAPGLGLVRRKDVSFTNVEVDTDEIRDEDDDDTGDRLELDEEDLRRRSLLGGGRMTLRLSLIMLLLIRLVLTSLKLRLNLLWSSSCLWNVVVCGELVVIIICWWVWMFALVERRNRKTRINHKQAVWDEIT